MIFRIFLTLEFNSNVEFNILDLFIITSWTLLNYYTMFLAFLSFLKTALDFSILLKASLGCKNNLQVTKLCIVLLFIYIIIYILYIYILYIYIIIYLYILFIYYLLFIYSTIVDYNHRHIIIYLYIYIYIYLYTYVYIYV